MIPGANNRWKPSPIYIKALEIFSISRHISRYMTDDLAYLNENGEEDPAIYFGGDIVQQSESLGPEILKAENEVAGEKKHKHVASVSHLINRLYSNCDRLERASSNGKDFLPVLRREIQKFRTLQRSWMLTL